MAIVQTHKGIKTFVSVGSVEIGGQDNARLDRTVQQVKITDMITMDWEEIITNVKAWKIVCNGLNIKDDAGFQALQDAFHNGTTVDVKVTDGNQEYSGKAYVTSIPMNSVFNSGWTYAVTLTGTGKLA